MDRKSLNHLLPSSGKEAELVGSIYFYTGIPCKRGHLEKRRTKGRSCLECIRLAAERYKLTDKYAKKTAERIRIKKENGEWYLESASRLLKHEYGITLEEYNVILKKQNNLCAICQSEEKTIDKRNGKAKRLAVDHCHKTNVIRGLLCWRCNTAIGKLKEDPDIIQRAANYVRNKGELK